MIILGNISDPNSVVVLIVSPGQSGEKIAVAVQLHLSHKNVGTLLIIYADHLLNFDLVAKDYITDPKIRQQVIDSKRDAWQKTNLSPHALDHDDKVVPNIADIIALHKNKTCEVRMWSAIIQEYPSIYQQGLELAKRLRLNDRKIARALDKNLKYFGDQWFGDKWRSILLSTDTPEHVEESRARQTALNEHADQEAAFVWTLVTVLSQYKRGMYLSHVGGLNYALVYFLQALKIEEISLAERMPFLKIDEPTRRERAIFRVQEEKGSDTDSDKEHSDYIQARSEHRVSFVDGSSSSEVSSEDGLSDDGSSDGLEDEVSVSRRDQKPKLHKLEVDVMALQGASGGQKGSHKSKDFVGRGFSDSAASSGIVDIFEHTRRNEGEDQAIDYVARIELRKEELRKERAAKLAATAVAKEKAAAKKSLKSPALSNTNARPASAPISALKSATPLATGPARSASEGAGRLEIEVKRGSPPGSPGRGNALSYSAPVTEKEKLAIIAGAHTPLPAPAAVPLKEFSSKGSIAEILGGPSLSRSPAGYSRAALTSSSLATSPPVGSHLGNGSVSVSISVSAAASEPDRHSLDTLSSAKSAPSDVPDAHSSGAAHSAAMPIPRLSALS